MSRTQIFLWRLLLFLLVGTLTYICVYEPDGNLAATVIGFSLFALFYWAIKAVLSTRYRQHHGFGDLLVLLLATIAVIICYAKLDEMAGVLVFWIPTAVSLIVLLSYLLNIIFGEYFINLSAKNAPGL